jgi:hypothetical protein
VHIRAAAAIGILLFSGLASSAWTTATPPAIGAARPTAGPGFGTAVAGDASCVVVAGIADRQIFARRGVPEQTWISGETILASGSPASCHKKS